MIEINDVVSIVKVPSKYIKQVNQYDIGIVTKVLWYNDHVPRISVQIQGKKNKYCADGHFNFLLTDLVKDDKNTLNAKHGKGAFMNTKLLKGYKIATVRFRDRSFQRDYKYVKYALYDTNIVPEDDVLCATANHGEVIGKVVSIEAAQDNVIECGRQIICKIDYKAYQERLQKIERIGELKLKMAKKKEELNELAVYELLAQSNTEMADMLKELKELI